VNPPYSRAAFINRPTHQAQSAAERGPKRGIGWRLFHSLVEQHGCAQESLEQSVVQFVHDVRTLSTTFFQTDIIFELRLSLARQPNSSLKRCFRSPAVSSHGSCIRAATGETIGVDGANPRRSAGNQDRMSG
jgi:hypothetical protein